MYISPLRGWQIAGCYFFSTETFFKRDRATIGIAQRSHSTSHIWHGLTCSCSHENSAPFQSKHIQRYIITNSATKYVWESVLTSTVRLWCYKVEPRYILFHGYYSHCQNSILKLCQLTLLPFFKNATELGWPRLLNTPFFFCSHTLTVNKSCLWLLEVQLWILCLNLHRVGLSTMKLHLSYPADCTKSALWIGGLCCTAFSWQYQFSFLFCWNVSDAWRLLILHWQA